MPSGTLTIREVFDEADLAACVDVVNRADVTRVEDRNGVQLLLETPAGAKRIEGSHLLVAVGRAPNSDRLNPAAAGLATDKGGFIPVNNRLETSVPGIYAIGDVKGGPAFTHISYDDYRILRANWLEKRNATTDGRLVPNTMFIDPQLATVGLNETEAAKRGLAYKVAKMPMTHVARAIEMSETRGFMKAIVDPRTGEILGCTILEDTFEDTTQLESLDPLPCPITLAWAREDRTFPIDVYGARAQQMIPRARFVVLDDVGHVPMFDDPQLVADTILAATKVPANGD